MSQTASGFVLPRTSRKAGAMTAPKHTPLSEKGAPGHSGERSAAKPFLSSQDMGQRMRSNPKADLKSHRVVAFAACELMLDMLYSISTTCKQDIELTWIILCVMQNTYRELITDPATASLYLASKELPESTRLCMSRRAIADKTGLSRETVRRRTNRLIEIGYLEEVGGAVRLAKERSDTELTHCLNQIHSAVLAFMKRIEEKSVMMPLS